MRLGDYTYQGSNTTAEKFSQKRGDFAKEQRLLREMLYQEMPSERIGKLASMGHARACKELAAVLNQIMNTSDPGLFSEAHKDQLIHSVIDMVLGLGPIEDLLSDSDITEIMVNGPSHVFFEKDGKLYPCSRKFSSENELRLVIDRIVSPLGRRIDEQSPIVNARLPEGHRVNVVIPPVSMDGSALTIRKFRAHAYTLNELVKIGTLSFGMAQLLRWAIKMRKNIAVCGGTGGGKTTLLNALSREIPKNERIITIEDSAELRFDEHPNLVRMEARCPNAEGKGEITIRELVINALRQRPDRIVVGECRGAEAADMLQAMNTGHDGSLTTLHANSPAEVISRLVMMVRFGLDLPTDIIEAQIASALDLIVQQDRMQHGKRRITKIVARHVIGSNESPMFPTQEKEEMFKTVVEWDMQKECYVWHAFPDWIEKLPLLNIASVQEVRSWEQSLHAS